MGYDRKVFLHDYDEFKCSEQLLTIIELGFQKESSIWKLAVDIFIGKYFAMKGYPNRDFDYTDYLSHFQTPNPSLYSILEKFWAEVLTCDIETGTLLQYLNIAGGFKDEIELWIISENRNSI